MILFACLLAYAVRDYNLQLESYYSYYQGELSMEEIREYLPMFGTIFGEYSMQMILMLILAAVLFGVNGIIRAVNGIVDDLFFEENDGCTCGECCDEECAEEEGEDKEDKTEVKEEEHKE